MAPPPHRPAGGALDEPCLDPFRSTVPLHTAPSSTPAPPSLSIGSPLARLLPCTHEDPGCDPPLPLQRQSGRAVTGRGGSIPFQRSRAPPCLLSLFALPSLGIRTAAQSQGGTAQTEPTAESQRQNQACGIGTTGGDGVTSERHNLNLVKLLAK